MPAEQAEQPGPQRRPAQQIVAFQEKMTPVWDSFADKIGKDLIQTIKETK